MKPIGTRSLSLAFVLVLVTSFAIRAGVFRQSTIDNFPPEVAVALGVFPILVGTWLFRIWDLGAPSRSYLRLNNRRRGGAVFEGEQAVLEWRHLSLLSGTSGRHSPRELPPLARRVGAQLVCMGVGLLCFNARTVPLMF